MRCARPRREPLALVEFVPSLGGWPIKEKARCQNLPEETQPSDRRLFQHGVIPGSSHIRALGISSPEAIGPPPEALQRWRATMEHYVGLDVSLKRTSICVVNHTGSVVREGAVDSDPEGRASRGTIAAGHPASRQPTVSPSPEAEARMRGEQRPGRTPRVPGPAPAAGSGAGAPRASPFRRPSAGRSSVAG